MTDTEILKGYYSEVQPFESPIGKRNSTIIAAIREARQITKRNISTGELDLEVSFGDIGNWLGAMTYMTILDQIGSSLNVIGEYEYKGRSEILKALKLFDKTRPDLEIHALIALRNAFFHNFNLIHIAGEKHKFKKEQTHRFTVYQSLESKLITLPTKPWDGDYQSKSWNPETETKVNLYQLGNLIEKVIKEIRQIIDLNKVKVVEPNIYAFLNKYTFITY